MKESGWKKWTGSRTGNSPGLWISMDWNGIRGEFDWKINDWKNKAEGWDWIGLEKKEKRKKMKESGWKKWTGSRTGKNSTGR
jgi:hypothetical protein